MSEPSIRTATPEETLVRQLPFWDNLSGEEKKRTVQGASVYKFKKGALIYGFQDACMGMVRIMKGSVRVSITSEEGREITLFHIAEGECCIFSSACVISEISLEAQLTAESDTELLAVHAGTVESLMNSNLNVKCFVYELATRRYSSVVWVMQQIIFSHFDQRLASLLLSLSEKTGSRTIRMTQEELAREVNSAREVVTRMLRRFASEGWISLTRGAVTLEDMDALRSLAGGRPVGKS